MSELGRSLFTVLRGDWAIVGGRRCKLALLGGLRGFSFVRCWIVRRIFVSVSLGNVVGSRGRDLPSAFAAASLLVLTPSLTLRLHQDERAECWVENPASS